MDSSGDESDWDEVEIPQLPSNQPDETIDIPLVAGDSYPQLEHDIEITLTRAGGTNKQQQEEAARKRQVAAQNRRVRLEAHKIHAVALLASLSIRNKWLNDDVLKARVLSLIPLPIQHGFASITKNAHPDPARRGRLFETALSRLVDWFSPTSSFAAQNAYAGRSEGWFRIKDHGHIRSHTFEAAALRARVLEARRTEREERRAKLARAAIKGKGKARAVSNSSSDESDSEEDEESEWYAPEVLRSTNSIAKHALQRSGSRDMAALVFVAMVRAMGIPARLVGSLQCVSWNPPKDLSTKRSKKKANRTGAGSHPEDSPTADDVEMEEVVISAISSPRIGESRSARGGSVLSSGASPRSERQVGNQSDGSTSFRLGTKRKRSALARGIDDDRRASGSSATAQNSSKLTEDLSRSGDDTAKGSPAPPVIKLRRARPTGNTLGSIPGTPWEPGTGSREAQADGPPTLWVEVFSRPDGRWLPVDPIRGIVNRARVFEEHKPGQAGANKLVYVVAMEEDGYARDVTARYAKNFAAKTAKARARVAAGGRGGKIEWWDSVMRILRRPYALHRDDIEDAELSHQRALEGLPNSIGAFKNHPIYALERHLRKDEAIFPRTEIAHFRGEPVFPRQNVLVLKPADGWMRQGRMIRAGLQPIKQSKARASTVRKKRELEMRREEEGEVMVGMYAHWQTELYVPPPVVDGKIPMNDFGNIDLYVPTMLPAGAVHIPHKGCAKIARKLGIHFAEAVTGFEFRKRQATPIINGIVIAAENEQMFLEALSTHVRAEELKENAKRRERVIQRWTRLVQGLRIVRRVNEQYSNTRGTHTSGVDADTSAPGVEPEEPGGFLDDLRDVVRPYNLPEAQHLVPRPVDDDDSAHAILRPGPTEIEPLVAQIHNVSHGISPDDQPEEADPEFEDTSHRPEEPPQHSGPPLTMQELADQQHKVQTKANSEEPNPINEERLPTPPLSPRPTRSAGQRQTKTREPIATRNTTRSRATQETIEEESESDQDDSEYPESAEPMRRVRASRRKRHAPVQSAGHGSSTSTRKLRPRRNR
ncbi:DNA repair protein RHP42 [Ceratobasidium sp. AG-Ba]|nr:DNA repair protein RHP42 [Ceratobasidium sp. AG-Ba]